MALSPIVIALLADEDGSQVVEYALVIALLSIVLALALNNTVSGLRSALSDLAARVGKCVVSKDGTC